MIEENRMKDSVGNAGGFPDNAELAGKLADAWLNVAQLFRLELQEGVKQLPVLVQLGLMRVPALLLVWCSFSLLISWWAYELTARPLAGFSVLFVLQSLLVIAIHVLSSRSLHVLSMPNTREYATRLMELMGNEAGSKARE